MGSSNNSRPVRRTVSTQQINRGNQYEPQNQKQQLLNYQQAYQTTPEMPYATSNGNNNDNTFNPFDFLYNQSPVDNTRLINDSLSQQQKPILYIGQPILVPSPTNTPNAFYENNAYQNQYNQFNGLNNYQQPNPIAPIEKELLKKCFRQIAGIDEKMDPNEFSILFQQMFPKLGPNASYYADKAFAKFDTNHDGYITYDEFLIAYQALKHFQI